MSATRKNPRATTAKPRQSALSPLITALCLLAGAAACEQEGCNDALATGDAARVPSDCSTQGVFAVLDLIPSWFPGVEASARCSSYQREVATGVTLGPGDGEEPAWNDLGGRGRIIADAAVCLLRDLEHRDPIAPEPYRRETPLGDIATAQKIGFLDWDPSAKQFRGYHQVDFCLPLLGCMTAQQQEFTATVKQSSPAVPSGWWAGDYPIEDSWAIEILADEADYELSSNLPTIEVATPVGPIEVTPWLTLSSSLGAVGTPFDGGSAWHEMASLQPLPLQDTNGRSGTVAVTALHRDGAIGGWVSQLALGGRDGDPNAVIWTPTDGPGGGIRPDLDPRIPRNQAEREANVRFAAGAEVTYDPLDRLPEFLRSAPFRTEARITVEPRFTTHHAAQLQLVAREGNGYRQEFRTHSIAEVTLQSSTHATAVFEIVIALYLSIEVGAGPFAYTLVDIDETLTVPLEIGEAQPGGRASAGAVSHSAPPREPSLGPIRTFGGDLADPESFLAECLEPPDGPGEMPPLEEPTEDSTGLAPNAFPCNVCVSYESIDHPLEGEVPGQTLLVLPSDTPGGSRAPWDCSPGNRGCFDLCSLDSSGNFDQVVRSGLEINPVGCSGTITIK